MVRQTLCCWFQNTERIDGKARTAERSEVRAPEPLPRGVAKAGGNGESCVKNRQPLAAISRWSRPGYFARTPGCKLGEIPREARYSGVRRDDGGIRAFHGNRNQTLAGDPAKLRKLILHLAEIETPLEKRLEQIETWKNLFLSSVGIGKQTQNR